MFFYSDQILIQFFLKGDLSELFTFFDQLTKILNKNLRNVKLKT